MNRRTLLTSLLAASACGAGSLPALAAPRPPMIVSRDLLLAFWDATLKTKFQDKTLTTNRVMRGRVDAFMAENGLSFPVSFVGVAKSWPEKGEVIVTLLGLEEVRNESGALELSVVFVCDQIAPGPQRQILTWEYPQA